VSLRSSVVVLGAVLAAATALVAVPAGAARRAYAKPVAGYKIGDPGVLRYGGPYVVLSTGRLGVVSTAPTAAGPWKRAGYPMLTHQARWASQDDRSLWAPSIVPLPDGQYLVVYAAVRAGQKSLRCIGTAIGGSPVGPFKPRRHPISCPAAHSGAADPMPHVGSNNSVIDATVRFFAVNGNLELLMTYKTQHPLPGPGKHYYTTIRMVRLDPATDGATVIGHSHQLTSRTGTIEENPVLVQRGNVFTLFTSVGGYTLCSYHTAWRSSTHPWHWRGTAQHTLRFPGGTCGTGDADVYSIGGDAWRAFFSGHYPDPGSTFKMYVGVVKWDAGTPRVTKLVKRR
jgi:arabinan endo-1,5-alpha-L-arabinosidase